MIIIILWEIKIAKKTRFPHFSADQKFVGYNINPTLLLVSISWLTPPKEKKLCGFFCKTHQDYEMKKIKCALVQTIFLQCTVYIKHVAMCEYRDKHFIRKKVFFAIFYLLILIINAFNHYNFQQRLQTTKKKKHSYLQNQVDRNKSLLQILYNIPRWIDIQFFVEIDDSRFL